MLVLTHVRHRRNPPTIRVSNLFRDSLVDPHRSVLQLRLYCFPKVEYIMDLIPSETRSRENVTHRTQQSFTDSLNEENNIP